MKIQQSKFGKLLMPTFAFFNIINLTFLIWSNYWDSININHSVVIFGNALLFLLAFVSLWLHIGASKKENPNVLVRSIMGSTFIKMMVIAISVLLYLKVMKGEKSKLAVITTMAIYLVYVFLEVKTALKLNKKQATK